MKIKTFKFLIIVALLAPLFLFSKTVYAETETVNDLLVTYSENLLPLTNDAVSFSNGTLTTKKKIYYPGNHEDYGLTVIIPRDSLNTDYTVSFTFYDIDFTVVGTGFLKQSKGYPMPLDSEDDYTSMYFNLAQIPDGTFSLSLTITGLNKNVAIADLGVMLLDTDIDFYDEYNYEYIDYVSTKGFIDLFNDIEASLEVSYKDPLTDEAIQGMVSIIDACEGDVKLDYTVDTSSYLNNKSKVGTYTVNITLTSDESNTVVGSFKIVVVDEIDPIIEGNDSIEVGAKATINKDYLKSKGYKFKDDYDDTNSIESTLIVTNSLGSTDNLGEGTLTLKLVDSNNNYTEKTISMTIVDIVKPTIEEVNKNLTISYEYILGVSSLVERAFTITDDYDDDLTIEIIEDNYTANSRTVGTYSVKIRATDDYENYSEDTFTVSVYDDIPPVIFLNTYRIETDVTIKLTKDNIVETLMASGILNSSNTYNVAVVVDEYTGNENKVGLYNYQLRIEEKNGKTMVKSLEINVSDISEYGGQVITNTAVIENDSDDRVMLAIVSGSLIAFSSIALIIIRRKKRTIRPRKY